MKQLEMLEQELKLLLENVTRVKKYTADNKGDPYITSSMVVGELKHRCVAIKQRLTTINKMSTTAMVNN